MSAAGGGGSPAARWRHALARACWYGAGTKLVQSWDTLYVHNELLCCFYPENETTVTFYMSQRQRHQRQRWAAYVTVLELGV